MECAGQLGCDRRGVEERWQPSRAGGARGSLKQAGCVPRQSILGGTSRAGPSVCWTRRRPAGLPSRTEVPRTKEASGIFGAAVCSIPAWGAAPLTRRAAAGSGSGTHSRRLGLCAGEKRVPACGVSDAGCAQAATMRTPAAASSWGRPLEWPRSSVAPDRPCPGSGGTAGGSAAVGDPFNRSLPLRWSEAATASPGIGSGAFCVASPAAVLPRVAGRCQMDRRRRRSMAVGQRAAEAVVAGEARAGEVGPGAVTVVDQLAVGSVGDAQRQLAAVADQLPQVDTNRLTGSRGEARVARDRRLPDLADHQWVPIPAVAMLSTDEGDRRSETSTCQSGDRSR